MTKIGGKYAFYMFPVLLRELLTNVSQFHHEKNASILVCSIRCGQGCAFFKKGILRLSILFLIALERFPITKLKFLDILMSATAAKKV